MPSGYYPLISRHRRGRTSEPSRLADELEAAARDARSPRLWTVRVQPLRAPVLECADDIDALIRRLRDDEPVDPDGVAMVRRLLRDGASPLYYERAPQTLRFAVRSARMALDVVGPEVPSLQKAA
jgi:hypothetical protein